MFADLANELVGYNGDVLDTGPTNGGQGVINDRPFMQRQHGFLDVAGKRSQPASVATCDEDGLEFHALWSGQPALNMPDEFYWESFSSNSSAMAPSLAFFSNQPLATRSPSRLTPDSMLSMSRSSEMAHCFAASSAYF